MEKILLPEYIGYKANLHSHSTDSDGDLTPEQMKEYYKANGYCNDKRKIICFTIW